MHYLLYEFVTGGGWLFVEPAERPQESLLREGLAMISAVAQDFAALNHAQVIILWDARLRLPALFEQMPNCRVVLIHSTGEHDEQLQRTASLADHTLLIAPEFDGHLLRICQLVEHRGGGLLSPNSDFIALAADKHATANFLLRVGVAVPLGVSIEPGDRLPVAFAYPAILKPRYGAGSQGVRLVSSAADVIGVLPRAMRLETYVRGKPASVAALCGPNGNVFLPACSQRLTEDGHFTYTGGQTPLAPHLAARAHELARHALGALAPTCGYVGIDMVLGEGGSPDVVIEVNPRLTTSYVGLRAIVQDNLAAAMLQTIHRKPPILSLRPGRVEFTAAGEVTWTHE